ncbi:hypothetical protein M422DRAFT_33365 [Sphaerobolus stellatus SS14]|uniref:F-box domain-containing protein n=1 Tax=Sphaerobolus stellatus (strain SS14) TaxID=990650 RepID=A0A0C9U5E4_SPHS4|nr:hypothetical protein M422DRAFT_33365 [Sphaerobolus stellatus SS14]
MIELDGDDEEVVVWPYAMQGTPERTAKASSALASLIRGMHRLESFLDRTDISLEVVYSALKESRPNLKEVHLCWLGLNQPPQPTASLRYLQNLTSFSINSQFSDSSLDALRDLLIDNCPLLQDIYIHPNCDCGGFRFNILWLFQQGNWHHLRRLNIGRNISLWDFDVGYDLETDELITIVSDFLRRHPMLECLWFWRNNMLRPRCIPPDAVPKLRRLMFNGTSDHTQLSNVVPIEVAEHLEFIWTDIKAEDSMSHIARMAGLKSCVVDAYDPTTIASLARAAPQLEHLAIHREYDRFFEAGFWDIQVEINYLRPYIAELLHFPALTHLTGLLRYIDPSTSELARAFIEELVTELPSLKYVETQVKEGVRKMISLERHPDGQYKGYHDTPRREIHPDFWVPRREKFIGVVCF